MRRGATAGAFQYKPHPRRPHPNRRPMVTPSGCRSAANPIRRSSSAWWRAIPDASTAEYWSVFKANVGRSHLASRRAGHRRPGLWPGTVSARPLRTPPRRSRLYGFDATPAMIDHAGSCATPGCGAHAGGAGCRERSRCRWTPDAVDLVSMTGLLHVLGIRSRLAEVRRVLRPGGVFLEKELDDWVRMDLASTSGPGRGTATRAPLDKSRRRWLRLFPIHNKYTVDDWKWLLAEAGFSLVSTVQLRPQSQIFVAVTRGRRWRGIDAHGRILVPCMSGCELPAGRRPVGISVSSSRSRLLRGRARASPGAGGPWRKKGWRVPCPSCSGAGASSSWARP